MNNAVTCGDSAVCREAWSAMSLNAALTPESPLRRPSPAHVVLAVHITCAAANFVLAAAWSSWALAATGAGWTLVAAALVSDRERLGQDESETNEPGSAG
ncbi:hypothetical protein AB0G02_08290 [Actinosynnema sp. NPDC023658]|uniref:hypothetical protein n=1 Tax=Actinosynnema sp. NPDC023658 TaxID=3155465 RepID=UPI0033E1D761